MSAQYVEQQTDVCLSLSILPYSLSLKSINKIFLKTLKDKGQVSALAVPGAPVQKELC